jgi:hypothetical protein
MLRVTFAHRSLLIDAWAVEDVDDPKPMSKDAGFASGVCSAEDWVSP